MDSQSNNDKPYELPITLEFTMSKVERVFVAVITVIFILVGVFVKEDISINILFFMLVIWLIFYYILLRPLKIEINEKHIKIYSKIKEKIIYWEDVIDISLIHIKPSKLVKSTYAIGVTTKRNQISSDLPFIIRLIISFFKSEYELRIQLKSLKGIDPERLSYTMRTLIKMEVDEKKHLDKILEDLRDKKNYDSLPFRGFVYIFCIAIFSGVIQGFLFHVVTIIDSLIINVIIYLVASYLPLVMTIWMILIFHNTYKEKRFSFLNRIVISTAILLLIVLGPMVELYFQVGKIPTIESIPKFWRVLIINFLRNINNYKTTVMVGVICIFIGLTHGFSSKLFIKIKKWLFKSRFLKYYYTKDSDMYTVYLQESEDFNEVYDELFQATIKQGSMIEKNKKKPLSFYIQLDVIREANLEFPSDAFITINNKEYFYIDLENRLDRNPEPYLLPCWVDFDREKIVKIVRFRYLK